MPAIAAVESLEVDTPFGRPSGAIRIGTVRGKRVAFLPRHGEGHVLSPGSLPYRANIFALKSLGVRFIIAVNAVGSLREDYAPGHIITPDQIIDYTIFTRARSFFETGLVAHVSVADPMSAYLRDLIADAAEAVGGTVHRRGTFLIEDGPRFATRADRHANPRELIRELDEAFAADSLAGWRKRLDEHGVAYGVISTLRDIPEDRQMHESGALAPIDDPDAGARYVVSSPLWIDGAARREPSRPPAIGEHSVEILREYGFAEVEIEKLLAAGVLTGPATPGRGQTGCRWLSASRCWCLLQYWPWPWRPRRGEQATSILRLPVPDCPRLATDRVDSAPGPDHSRPAVAAKCPLFPNLPPQASAPATPRCLPGR